MFGDHGQRQQPIRRADSRASLAVAIAPSGVQIYESEVIKFGAVHDGLYAVGPVLYKIA